ncbi:putative histone H3.3-like type 3 [Lucilia sericata]|uniref:putative histone H3.3-like type 3 n=1 Tax=Lucilia sericata TaxID=13632 RepID=UPI0018A86ECF|nr:putative histone H3.3-like type 3 [Lucilia sericata]
MPRGTLGESDSVIEEGPVHNFDYRTRSSITNPYEQASTSRAATSRTTARKSINNAGNSNTLKGAARRKKRTPRQREMRLLKSIMQFQKTTTLLIPRAPFARLVREISLNVNPDIARYTITALEALQEATEMFMVQLLQDSYLLTMHRKCVTLSTADMMLIRALKLNL